MRAPQVRVASNPRGQAARHDGAPAALVCAGVVARRICAGRAARDARAKSSANTFKVEKQLQVRFRASETRVHVVTDLRC
eukprot:4639472-Prymnesium_polylepis.1